MPEYPRPRRILTRAGSEEVEAPYVPELSPVTDRQALLMTRPWLDWCRRVSGFIQHSGGGDGTGDVVGPPSATDDAIAVYSGITGKLLKDSLKTIANVITDAVNAAVAAILPGGKLPDSNLSANVARRDQNNIFTASQQAIAALDPYWEFSNVFSPAHTRRWTVQAAATQQLIVRALDDTGVVLATPLVMNRDGNVTIDGNLAVINAISELSRSTPLGYWVTVPFNAGDYTASAGLTWSITSGNVLQNMYTLIGKTIIWTVSILNATLNGTSAGELYIRIPNGIPLVLYSGNERVADARAGTGFVEAVAYVAGTDLALAALSPTAWPASSGTVVLKFTLIAPLS